MVLWVFGYGSVMWTREFHYVERVVGYVKDYQRVLAECGDGESRISPGSANYGLALEAEEGAVTRGVAYRVADDVEKEILSSYLSCRPSSGHSCQALWLDFFAPSAPDFPTISGVMTFVNPPESSRLWYLVPQDAPKSRSKDISSNLFYSNSPKAKSGRTSRRRVSRRTIEYQMAIVQV